MFCKFVHIEIQLFKNGFQLLIATGLIAIETGTYKMHLADITKKDTSVTFWAEQKKFCQAYDTSMTIIVTKPGIIIDVVGSYFYDKKS